MAAAGVVADTVTLLSKNWSDLSTFVYPTDPATGRTATTTYYRTAIAGGKNMNFPFPNWESATNYGTGTDGGVHNFLRFLEDWSTSSLYYEGSMVSLPSEPCSWASTARPTSRRIACNTSL